MLSREELHYLNSAVGHKTVKMADIEKNYADPSNVERILSPNSHVLDYIFFLIA